MWNRVPGRPIGINLSWEVRQEAGRSVGARVDDEGWGGGVFPQDISEMNRYAGDPKGPPNPTQPRSPLRMLMSDKTNCATTVCRVIHASNHLAIHVEVKRSST